ncbi:MAG: ATP-binding cassette domain-containing protein, partial [Flavobacterium sp.]
MRLTQLNISDYKNLNVDLQNSNAGIVAFIGNNGSGKSNILEALSIIFSHLFQKKEKDIPFNFSISYEIGSARNKVSIQKQKTSVTTSIDGEKKSDPYNYLPKQIIAIYSGEEDRLWRKCYRPLYMEYIRDITSAHNSKLGIYNELPRMLYVNKFYWHISLLCLLLNRKYNPNDEFCKNILGIKNVNSVKFIFNKSNYSGYAESLVKQFIQEIDHKDEYSLEDFQKLVDGKGYNLIDVYKYLYIAFTPDKKKMLENIIIKYNDENLEVEDFSEGEKKMLLIKAALEFAGLEDSLFVLDEPDAHIHLSNKVEIKKVFNHYSDNRQVIITTHSPTLTDTLEEESLIMMNSGKLVPHKKQEILENVSGDFWNKFQQNAFIASKSPIILLVEGKHDKEHIQNAYNILKDEYSDLKFDIFHMNSACNIPPMMLGLRTNEYKHNKIIIGLFDDDETGRAECDKTACYFPNEQNQKRHVENYFSLKYPKYEGYKSKDFTVEKFFGAQIVNDA